MLNPKYIKKVQDQLRHYHTMIFTSPKTNNAFILTNSANVNQMIRMQAVAKNHRWIKLTNQQFIHAQRFTDQDYNLNFNYRQNNAIDDLKRNQLSHDLLANFGVKMTVTGKLVINIKSDIVTAFVNLMNAILYLKNNGSRYLVHTNQINRANQQLQQGIRLINHARQSYRTAKNRGRSSHQKRQFHQPKAHGKIVAGFSSTAGTPREIRYAKERKARQKKHILLSKHSKIIHQNKHLKQQKFNLQNKKIVLSGHLHKSRSYYNHLLKKINGKLQQKVNGQTDFLICNHPNYSQNYRVAKQRNIKIINENQIL